MNRRDLLALVLGLPMTSHTSGLQKSPTPPDRYALFRTKREGETKSSGTYQIRIDNRILEMALPEPEPNLAAIAQSVTSKGNGEDFERALNRVRRVGGEIPCFQAGWKYGILDGALFGNSEGWISVHLNVNGDTYYLVEDPEVIEFAMGSVVKKGRKRIYFDYERLNDFLLALQPATSRHRPWPHTIERINGRQWVRTISWQPRGGNYDLPPPRYIERWYTPTKQGQYLVVAMELRMPLDYLPSDLPTWAQRASRNITAVLRSIKLSPPDDGSPDPFLIDPEQKAEVPPVEFPAQQR